MILSGPSGEGPTPMRFSREGSSCWFPPGNMLDGPIQNGIVNDRLTGRRAPAFDLVGVPALPEIVSAQRGGNAELRTLRARV
jgi:hypothetical protein